MKITVKQLKRMIRESAMSDSEEELADSSYAITQALEAIDGALEALSFLDDSIGNGEQLPLNVSRRAVQVYLENKRKFMSSLTHLKASLSDQ